MARLFLCAAFMLTVAVASAPSASAQGFTSFSPTDGASVTTTEPTFTLNTTGFDPNQSTENPWVAVSSSFQVDFNGTLANTFGCLFQFAPTGPGSSVYMAAATPASWQYCPLQFGQTYYWQMWFYTADPAGADPSVSCTGVTCHTAVMTLHVVAPTPDFSLSITPGSGAVTAPGTSRYAVSAAALNGFNSTIQLAVSGLPAGATSSWQTSGSAQVLTITVSHSAPAGTYTFTVTGMAGDLTHTVTAQLSITAAPPDTTAPVVHAYPARGIRRKKLKLRFAVHDDSGEEAVALGVYKGNKTLSTQIYRLGSYSGIYVSTWRPLPKGSYRFCVVAQDAAGNRSGVSCVPFSVR